MHQNFGWKTSWKQAADKIVVFWVMAL